jgi:hypothetical protein
MFVTSKGVRLGRPFQRSLMFVSKAGEYPSEASFVDAFGQFHKTFFGVIYPAISVTQVTPLVAQFTQKSFMKSVTDLTHKL